MHPSLPSPGLPPTPPNSRPPLGGVARRLTRPTEHAERGRRSLCGWANDTSLPPCRPRSGLCPLPWAMVGRFGLYANHSPTPRMVRTQGYPRGCLALESPNKKSPTSACLGSQAQHLLQRICSQQVQMARMDSNNLANTTSLGLVEGAESQTRPRPPTPQELPRLSSKRRRMKTKNLDWARHRDVLKQLYMHEEKTLKDVMRIMESRHGFVARSVSRLLLLRASLGPVHSRV